MGLIMLILIGTVPTAYALNHAITYKDSQDFIAVSAQAADALTKYVSPNAAIGDAHEDVTGVHPRLRISLPTPCSPCAPWSATSATRRRCTKK